jgi:hypothetical protein
MSKTRLSDKLTKSLPMKGIGMRIRISWPAGEVFGVLGASETARLVFQALPHRARANTWGEEVYFDLPVKAVLDAGARDVVDPGTICYWVQGSSLALPFGPTPVSKGSECRLVTAVNILGNIEGNPRALGKIRDGDMVSVEVAKDDKRGATDEPKSS